MRRHPKIMLQMYEHDAEHECGKQRADAVSQQQHFRMTGEFFKEILHSADFAAQRYKTKIVRFSPT